MAPNAATAEASGGFWAQLFDTSDFPPRWNCGNWDATLGWLHIGSDIAIWAAYLAIPVLLFLLLRRHHRSLPVRGVGLLFCAFILSCGATHLFEAIIFYWPAYRVAGLLKLGTALVSIATVVALVRMLPTLLQLRGPSELKREVDERTRALQASERACTRERDRAASADRAKSRFLATMSHELRTPLAAILGHAELLVDDVHELDPEERRRCLETIHRSAEHQLAIINDVLELSKIEAGEMAITPLAFDPVDLAERSVDLVRVRAEDRDNTVEFVGPSAGAAARLANVVADPTRVQQVLVNLLSNATKFTASGRITVELDARAEGDGLMLEYLVRDTGIGMSPDQARRVFDPYRQAERTTYAQHGGTGLGLAISREIARALGGDLEVESAAGVGSTFRFRFRASTGALDDVPSLVDGRQVDVPLAGTRVLLVEDQYDLALVTRKQLERVGCEVEHVGDGEAALGRARVVTYDLVLLDLQLPGIGGDEVLVRLRASGWTGPVVALTANALTAQRDACLELGFDDFATKPLRGRALVELVARHTSPASDAA